LLASATASEIAAKAFAKAASGSTPTLVKFAMSKRSRQCRAWAVLGIDAFQQGSRQREGRGQLYRPRLKVFP
jgi:hypothetical protein